MATEAFENADLATLVMKEPRTNASGAGKTLYIDRTDRALTTLFESPADLRVAWPIRPGAPEVRPDERLNLEVEIITSSLFEDKLKKLDSKFLTEIFDKRVAIFGAAKARNLATPESLLGMYRGAVREGAEKKGGGFYSNSIRVKVDGWADSIEKLVFKDIEKNGKPLKMMDYCVWKERRVHASGTNGPTDRDTAFFLFGGKDSKTGRDKWFDKVPVVNDGRIMRDDNGAPIMRWVGPQDCNQNSQVRIIFNVNKIYVTESCGPTLSARKVFVKPAPPKQTATTVSGGDIVDASAEEALLALAGGFVAPQDDAKESPKEDAPKSEEDSESPPKRARVLEDDI